MRASLRVISRSLSVVIAGPVIVATLAGCPPKDEPSGDDGAKYFGFVVGEDKTYAGGALDEVHAHAESNVASDEGVTVDLLARSSGFVVQERSFTIEFTGTTSFLRRFNDCVNPCAQPDAPIPFLDWPLESGAQLDSTTTVTLSENGTETGTEEQQHTILVSDEQDVTVPAGDFSAFLVSWTKAVGGDVKTDTLLVAPDDGIVKWTAADGTVLELK